MRPRTNRRKERCGICGKDLRSTTITHQTRRGNRLYIFENVPAQVCSACGEVWIEETTLEEIDRLIKEGEPTGKVEHPDLYFILAAVNSTLIIATS